MFGNDPARVASGFARHLTGEGRFRAAFRKVVLAVLDRSTNGPFDHHFGAASP